jgi:pyruvate/oxaloacetate carboxyltransferase
VAALISKFKKELNVPIDFHTHCTPGYGLGSVLSAIVNGVDIVDTNIWYFSGGPAAPAIELVYLFCQKLGIELDINMEAVAKINAELLHIRRELDAFDAVKQFPIPFNPLTDTLPAHVDQLFDDAIVAAKINDEAALLSACHAIESYFNFPLPDEKVKNAEIPGGMYTNMVAQLKQFNALDILDDAMKLIPSVRLDAGLPPLVTPTSQIVGAQAVNSILNLKKGRDKYANASNQFVSLVKGEYGKTPIPVDPAFRETITGSSLETPYDTSKYKRQENPLLPEFGNVPLAGNEEEELLLELFPTVAGNYLKKIRAAEFEKQMVNDDLTVSAPQPGTTEDEPEQEQGGQVVSSPMPGAVMKIVAREGDVIDKGAILFILESMKMENEIISEYGGKISKIYAKSGDMVQEGQPIARIMI